MPRMTKTQKAVLAIEMARDRGDGMDAACDQAMAASGLRVTYEWTKTEDGRNMFFFYAKGPCDAGLMRGERLIARRAIKGFKEA